MHDFLRVIGMGLRLSVYLTPGRFAVSRLQLQSARLRHEPAQLAAQAIAHGAVRRAADDVLHLVRVALEIVELVELAALAAVDPVDVLVTIGAHRLVGHADEPGIGVLGPVFDQERLTPAGAAFSPPSREQRDKRAPLYVRTGPAACELQYGRRDVLAQHEVGDPRAGADAPRIAHKKGRAYPFLVGEAAF